MTPVQIFNAVAAGRLTPEEGARLLQVERERAWAARPWWDRALAVLARAIGGGP